MLWRSIWFSTFHIIIFHVYVRNSIILHKICLYFIVLFFGKCVFLFDSRVFAELSLSNTYCTFVILFFSSINWFAVSATCPHSLYLALCCVLSVFVLMELFQIRFLCVATDSISIFKCHLQTRTKVISFSLPRLCCLNSTFFCVLGLYLVFGFYSATSDILPLS